MTHEITSSKPDYNWLNNRPQLSYYGTYIGNLGLTCFPARLDHVAHENLN